MIKIKMLRNTVCGGASVKIGQIVDASEADARFLLRTNKAELYKKPKAKRSAKAEHNRMITSGELQNRESD